MYEDPFMRCSPDVGPAIKVIEDILRKDTSDGSDRSEIIIKFALATTQHGDVSADTRQATDAVTTASEAIGSLSSTPAAVGLLSSALNTGAYVASEIQTFKTTWGVLLKRMKLFNEIVADIAQVSCVRLDISTIEYYTDSSVCVVGLVCHISCEQGMLTVRSSNYHRLR